MLGMMITGVLTILGFVIAVALAIMAVWRAVVPPSGTPRTAGCGSCGYELGTTAAGRCPECGADLLRCGITTRSAAVRLASSLPAALTGWTFIVLSIAVVILQIVSVVGLTQSVASGMNYTSNHIFAPVPPANPNPAPGSAAVPNTDFRLTINIDIVGTIGQPATSGDITLELTANNAAATFTFADASTNDWVLTDGAGATLASGRNIRSDDVLDAFRAVGLDPAAHPDVSDYADRIETLAAAALTNPHTYDSVAARSTVNLPPGVGTLRQVGGSSGYASPTAFTTTSPADLIAPLIIGGVAVSFWILGIVLITRRRARLIAGPKAAS